MSKSHMVSNSGNFLTLTEYTMFSSLHSISVRWARLTPRLKMRVYICIVQPFLKAIVIVIVRNVHPLTRVWSHLSEE